MMSQYGEQVPMAEDASAFGPQSDVLAEAGVMTDGVSILSINILSFLYRPLLSQLNMTAESSWPQTVDLQTYVFFVN